MVDVPSDRQPNPTVTWCAVSVEPGCKISAREAAEFVELFYPGSRPGRISVSFLDQRGGKRRKRGECLTMGGSHQINIFWRQVADEIGSGGKAAHCGGNRTAVSDPRLGCFLTLAHELRHAYQAELHWHKESFFSRRGYASRPCEVDARRHVDESYVAICEFLGITPDPAITDRIGDQPEDSYDLLDELIEVLAESEEVTAADLRSELAAVGLNNPISFRAASDALAEEGVRVIG